MLMNDSSCALAHNTPLPLKRSPAVSFKRLLGRCSLCVSLGSTKRDEQSRHDEATDHKPEGLPEAPDPHPAVLRVQLISHAKRNYHERTGGSAYLAVVLRPARSEERRVGKECRCRGETGQYKKNDR